MKKKGILNAKLMGQLTALKHTDMVVICDSGFPVPEGANLIDISLVRWVPTMEQTLKAVVNEINVEKYYFPDYLQEWNPTTYDMLHATLTKQEGVAAGFADFDSLANNAKLIIRTGEACIGGNVILVSSTGADGYDGEMCLEF